MKRFSLVIMAVIWIGLGVVISWVNGYALHNSEHSSETAGHTEQVEAMAPGH